MAKRRRKRKSSSIRKIKTLLSKLVLIGVILGGYYLSKHPELIPAKTENISSEKEASSSAVTLSNFVDQEQISKILGKTTSLVEEGLENIKVPKQISGSDEEIVLQDAFDQFSQKIKDLPVEQIDRVKIQFCQDILESVENASITVKE